MKTSPDRASTRIEVPLDRPLRPDGAYVLYWMRAARRPHWNHALDRAVDLSRALGKPLVVLEALRRDYPHACPRHHQFIIDGMRSNERAFAAAGVRYLPYVEPQPGADRGLLAALAAHAAVVVTDRAPMGFLPLHLEQAAARLNVRIESVDAAGVIPLDAPGKAFARAVDFRRHLQATAESWLGDLPRAQALEPGSLPPPPPLPADVLSRWAPARLTQPLAGLSLDGPAPVSGEEGGWEAGERRWRLFLDNKLHRFGTRDANDEPSSHLSAHLHYGHLSPHQLLVELGQREGFDPDATRPAAKGQREGWWGMSAPAEAFLDQLLVWRELSWNGARWMPDWDRYEGLPDWARSTLEARQGDEREAIYDLETLEEARTHDPLWNAAQRQLVQTGRIHGYLRMLWGKHVLRWSPSPRLAFERLLLLNDRYALDGRDPCSVAGISWVLGRYDRPWFPTQPVLGTVRRMTSASTMRKMKLDGYLRRFGPTSR